MATSISERFNIGIFPESAPAYYLWEVAGKPSIVKLSLDVVDRLSGEIISKFADINSRGSELGGILLGRVADADETTFFIDDYELIECDHKLGALFLLSDEDKSRMVDQLLRLRCSSSRSVIGFFRSHTRKNLGLDERDLSLIQDYFADAANVFLLVKPFAVKPSTAGFFIWEDGQICAESSYRQFPFKRSELVIRADETVLGLDAESDTPEMPRLGWHKASEALRRSAGATPPTEAAGDITPPPEEPQQNIEVQNPIDLIVRQISREATETQQFSARLDLKSDWSMWQQSPPTVLSRMGGNVEDAQPHSSFPLDRDPFEDVHDGHRPAVDGRDLSQAPWPVPSADRASTARGARGSGISYDAQGEAPWQDDTAAMATSKSGHLWFRWIFVLLLLAVIGTAYVESRRAHSMPPAKPANNALDLSIVRNADAFEFHWNQHATPIAAATNGKIQIEDGNRTKNLELTVDQLRTGKVIYFPVSNDVGFQLEVTDASDSRSISESIHTGGRLRALANNPADGLETR